MKTVEKTIQDLLSMTEQEFNAHISRIRPRLIHFACGFHTGGAATPEDLVQEAVLKVWKMNAEGNVPKNIEAVSVAILKNVCLDYLKLKKNRSRASDGKALLRAGESSPHKILEMKDRVAALRIFVRTLPPEQQLTLRLRDVMGYELAEIARILDTSEGNIRTLLSRARQKIRKELGSI